MESWEYQNSQPRIQTVEFSMQSASTTVQAFDWHLDGLYQVFDYKEIRTMDYQIDWHLDGLYQVFDYEEIRTMDNQNQ